MRIAPSRSLMAEVGDELSDAAPADLDADADQDEGY